MKGIMFCELLNNKTVAKEKTMTRRAPASLKVINENPDDWQIHQIVNYKSSAAMLGVHFKNKNGKRISAKPTYKVGEVVYIKEPWAAVYYDESGGGDIIYKYDFPESERHLHKWSNKLFTGADKARYYIRITSVKVERLYDISDEDCLKEGIDVDKAPYREDFFYDYQNNDYSFITPKGSFFSLFRFANKVPKSREIPNLWVFCYSYCLCDKEGNEL